MAKPAVPRWYYRFVPVEIVRAVRDEDARAAIVLCGAIAEAVRRGEEPIFLMQDLVHLIARETGIGVKTAYKRLASLSRLTLGGKRFLRVVSAQEWVPTTGSGRGGDSAPEGVPAAGRLPARGLAVRPGEALEPWIRMLIRRTDELDEPHILQTEILQMENPDDKRGTLGGGGENIHGGSHPEKPPPPPEFSNVLHLENDRRMENVRQMENILRLENPALRAAARRIGVATRVGLAAVAASGLGPRALLRYWERVREGGGGVGALVASLADGGEAVRGLIPPPDSGSRPAFDPCPACGEDLAGSGWRRARDRCPACGAALRECPACGELAPLEGACPWCGADPPREAEALPEPDPEAGVRAVWTEALMGLQHGFPTILRDARLEEVLPEEDGWRLQASAPDPRMAAAIENVAPAIARILGVRVRIECQVRQEAT